MKQLIIILITVFTLSITGILYATHTAMEKHEIMATEYVHLGQVDQPMFGFTQW
jgi:hypothetical protein